ncbi:probable membrane-associated kinase regulator 3 [Triticum urartu]|uniref:probable membrane-associated kinase regulator 3 n=1 Tax=Triticum urartu TaxID=4572 RepID=UPI002043BFA5|nr:probable membrane-associated kinase regulator 3 [Triticum urartu]
MARAPTMVVQDDYIDMDLSPSSPQCALLEFEFQSAGGGGGGGVSRRREEAAYASPADELFYRGKLLPLHLPPRLQLVQKLLQEQQVNVPEIKPAVAGPAAPSVSASADVEDGGDGKVGAKRYSWSKRLKLMKRWTSREYIKSLFLAKAGDLGIVNGGGGGRERASLLDQDELCSHRRSFSGIIRRVRLVVATKAAASASAPPGTSPLCSSSSASSSSSSTPSCGDAERFFLRPRAAAMPVLKRSSSAGSEEGAIQGAIAHCKRSHQQLLQQGRKSASGVVFYSVSNTPRISTSVAAAAANESSQERQEMCRG